MATQAQKDAYNDLKPGLALAEQAVFDVITLAHDGATLREIADALGLEMGSASGRVCGLIERGLVVNSGERRLNPKTKKNITVYKIPSNARSGRLTDNQPRLL